MQIPIENVYYLLCYAWNKLEEKDLVRINPTATTSLVDLFAKVLIGGTNHLIKRGFDRGYVQFAEETRRMRGKIAFSPTLKRNLLKKGFIHCEFDELSYNILHNRILKTTIRNLTGTHDLDSKLKQDLIACYHRLHEVDELELTGNVFGLVQLNRNNYFYDFLMRVCELLHTNLLPTERSGVWQFTDFLQDEKRMPYLFEEFVRNFYRIEARQLKVKREDIYWQLTPADAESAGLLPDMQTDISLISADSKLIIECKYMAGIEPNRYGTPKLRSAHLYQLNAYLTNLPDGDLNDACRAILLYPTIANDFKQEYSDSKGRKITVRTINLNQGWQGIHQDLLAMVA
jgi:5-methylcytosine-specific restriction enzyme subunit McrC